MYNNYVSLVCVYASKQQQRRQQAAVLTGGGGVSDDDDHDVSPSSLRRFGDDDGDGGLQATTASENLRRSALRISAAASPLGSATSSRGFSRIGVPPGDLPCTQCNNIKLAFRACTVNIRHN